MGQFAVTTLVLNREGLFGNLLGICPRDCRRFLDWYLNLLVWLLGNRSVGEVGGIELPVQRDDQQGGGSRRGDPAEPVA